MRLVKHEKGESGALERKYKQLRSMFGFKTVLIMHGLHQLSEPRGYLFTHTHSFVYSLKQRQWFEKLGRLHIIAMGRLHIALVIGFTRSPL